MKRKRFAIVHAARKLFLEGGYAKTSMDSIAEASGVGSELLTAGMVVCPQIAQTGLIGIFSCGF